MIAIGVLASVLFGACTKDDSFDTTPAGPVEPAEMTGEVIVKFAPYVSDILDSVGAATTRCGAPATRSGILSVDEVLDLLGGCEVERIFPVDTRYEERTRRAELHLWYAVRFGKEFTVDEVISRLSQLGEVQTATPNRVIKRAYREDRKAYPVSQRMLERSAVTRASGDYAYNDVLLPWQWHIINRGYRDNFVIGETDGKTVEEVQAKYKAGADVNCEKAWERTTGDPSIVVAVLDEGIYWRHPDLVNNMWENEDEPYYSDAAGEHVSYEDRDGNGYAGDHFGYDSINNTGVISCDASADTGHGTHVAGVIAARNNNGIGIASIAGGTEDAPGVKVRPRAAMYMSSCRIATAIPSRYTRISTVSGRAASRGRTASIRTMLWGPSYAACMTTRTATGRAAMSSATCTRTA